MVQNAATYFIFRTFIDKKSSVSKFAYYTNLLNSLGMFCTINEPKIIVFGGLEADEWRNPLLRVISFGFIYDTQRN